MNTQMNAFNQINKENINPIDKNLYLYVPRTSLRTTEDQVKDLFFRNQIGNVEYCDLVTIKDKDTKQPLYAQLFIKLRCWNMFSNARADFERNGSIKIFLTGAEFWMILPNKNPLPRTHVNTSQLAASTEKLFEKSEAMEKKMDSFEDEMRSEMAEMRAFMKLQQAKIEELEFKLSVIQLSCDATDPTLFSRTVVAKEEPEEKVPEEKVPEEDGLKIPELVRCYSIQRETKIEDEDACIFSLNKVPRSLSPVPILISQTEPEPLTLADIVLKNPEKAIASRDFCGNS
jgi:hypothetical protein